METPTTTAIAIATQETVNARDSARQAVREAYIAMLAKPGVKTAGAFAIANTNLHAVATQFGKERKSATIERNWRAASATMYLRPDRFEERINEMVAECGPLTAANFLAALQGVIRKSLQTLAAPSRSNAIATTSTGDGASRPQEFSFAKLCANNAIPAIQEWLKLPAQVENPPSGHAISHAYVPSNLWPEICKDGCFGKDGKPVFRGVKGIDPINERPAAK